MAPHSPPQPSFQALAPPPTQGGKTLVMSFSKGQTSLFLSSRLRNKINKHHPTKCIKSGKRGSSKGEGWFKFQSRPYAARPCLHLPPKPQSVATHMGLPRPTFVLMEENSDMFLLPSGIKCADPASYCTWCRPCSREGMHIFLHSLPQSASSQIGWS